MPWQLTLPAFSCHVFIKPISKPRKGWEKAFKEMSENGDDKLLMNDVFEDENLEEWK